MFWKKPEYGTIVTVTGFLWWPITIGGVTRWLEYASYSKKWVHFVDYSGCGDEWEYIEWLDMKKDQATKPPE